VAREDVAGGSIGFDSEAELGMVPELDEICVATPLLDAACERLDEGLGASKELEDVWNADDNAAREADELCIIELDIALEIEEV